MCAKDISVRKASVAGAFYPGTPDALLTTIEQYFAEAPAVPAGRTLAVMAPHAGYAYSGKTAAASIKALKEADYDTVVVIGHDFGRNAPRIPAVFTDVDAFSTPLGQVSVDKELQAAILGAVPGCVIHNGVHQQEHTIEVQLPFLQALGRPFKVLPVLFGEVTPSHCRKIVDALLAFEGRRKIVILASSDMTHYPTAENSRRIDADTLRLIAEGQLDELCRRSDGTGVPQCKVATPLCATGGVGVAMLWAEAHGCDAVKVVASCNSGDATGDTRRVVGYGAVVFSKTGSGSPYKVSCGKGGNEVTVADTNDADFTVSPAAQRELLSLVRRRIEAKATGADWHYEPPAELEELLKPSAVFVTLTKGGRLRGCIGTTEARNALWQVVEYFATAAAFGDPRFQPVTASEIPQLHIEISVLSPLAASSAEKIVPFKHGVVVRSGRRSGLFLPQVWEQLPDMENFMGYLCSEKAGLPRDAWKNPDGVKIYTFTVAAFEEGK